jgi:hypothetical protein
VVPIPTTKPTELWEYYVNKYSKTSGTPETGDDDEDDDEDDDDTDDSTSPSPSTTTHEEKTKDKKHKDKPKKKKKKEEPNYWDVYAKDHKGYTPPEEEEEEDGDDDKHKHKHKKHKHKHKKEESNGCCSRDFKTCASGEGDNTEHHCDMQYQMKWLKDGALKEDDKCKARYIPCTRDKHSCCPGLKCKGNQWFKQCTHPNDHGP